MSRPPNHPTGDYVQMDDVDWAPFPPALCNGAIRWKLLHVSPESGAWTALFDCPAGSSFARHVHMGPGEYFLTRGRMLVRGGADIGGATAIAPAYGYEACNARHDHTEFTEDSEFYMTFLGPLNFIDDAGNTLALVGCKEVLDAWQALNG
ncbi:MAG: acetylacetone-cleaving protein [Pseudomonadales bacterium]|nr:acetylacetone-cleaving protein [Pseudomonadales bacterium]MCP5185304.1 acetylacetone-cleaving protein [Pseudomonadales bacterium]